MKRFGALFFLAFPALATSIVAIVGEATITIAADGVLLGNSVETGEPVRTSICKIRCRSRACFAASGRYNNTTIGYDVWRLAEEELHNDENPRSLARRFKNVIAPLIPRLVATSKKETPRRYAEWLMGRPVLAYLFAGFGDNDRPVVVSGQARIDAAGQVLPIDESVREGRPGGVGLVLLGWNEHIGDFMNQNPTWGTIASVSQAEMAERMVRIEIQAADKDRRQDVGEPVVVVSLTSAMGFGLVIRGACLEK